MSSAAYKTDGYGTVRMSKIMKIWKSLMNRNQYVVHSTCVK